MLKCEKFSLKFLEKFFNKFILTLEINGCFCSGMKILDTMDDDGIY